MARRQQKRQPSPVVDKPSFEIPQGRYVESVGRRKMATARVRIYEQKDGQFIVNDQLVKDYFVGINNAVKVYTQPFE
ncbi:30S ribosomal protein S9, partial [Patescibacteria group bacterium]|nr:30S ribosomal protein S9 [Patescibacteria group bacterium]MBU1885448.1 30S ribosomal protein S9 [Patescibacteria group bacterium]